MKFVNFFFSFLLLWHGIKRTTLSSKGFLKSRVWKKFRIFSYTGTRPSVAEGHWLLRGITSQQVWLIEYQLWDRNRKRSMFHFLPSECMHKVQLQHFRRHIFFYKNLWEFLGFVIFQFFDFFMWIESGADVFKSLIMNGSTMLPCVDSLFVSLKYRKFSRSKAHCFSKFNYLFISFIGP